MFADADADVAPTFVRLVPVGAGGDVVEGRAVEIGAGAHEVRHLCCHNLHHRLARLARGSLASAGKGRNLGR
jgi:hypothetical protein